MEKTQENGTKKKKITRKTKGIDDPQFHKFCYLQSAKRVKVQRTDSPAIILP